ncbi:hypothetical protein CHLRE_09g394800v5 [Chlamydomonas reinhardtii]|uniref:ADP/ATP translocase n=1 Tax=Chlamydomonas reinhardtii TaxID=3055 RepID=A0A2K3DD93_CHLRE|nr:uncharacterized protein CHLRE_09g394800v5 [Chlamydomonas reinhardtii]PNW78500.1 hypothetical protein CHLRE_09g394800v5 [Chlamydomonas reinhardtii]
MGQVELLSGPLASGRPPGKPLVIKENWTAALSDQLRLFSVQLICSGGSSAVAKTMVAPLERIKILLQVQHMAAAERAAARYTGVRDVLARLPAREGGVLSLWRGNGANVARLFPDVAFRFAVHDQFRVMFAPLDGSPPGVAEKLAAGAATGVLKTALFYPLDLCRTRITADQSLAATASATAASASMTPTMPAAAAGPAAAGQAAGAGAGAGAAGAGSAATGTGTGAGAKLGAQAVEHAGAAGAAATGPSSAAAAPQAASATGAGGGRPTAGGPAASSTSHVRGFASSSAAAASAAASTSVVQAQALRAGQGAGPGPGSGGGGGGGAVGRTYPNIRVCMVATLREEGVRGLYRGCLLSMGGVAPYLAISFTMYDELRRRLPADRESVSAWWYPLLKMGCGAAAAVSAQTVVYPLDTVRRCMQMNGAAGQAVRYRSAYDCLRQLLRSPGGGLAALYRGCAANCLKTSIGAPIHFIMYDAIKAGIQAVDPTTGVSSPL